MAAPINSVCVRHCSARAPLVCERVHHWSVSTCTPTEPGTSEVRCPAEGREVTPVVAATWDTSRGGCVSREGGTEGGQDEGVADAGGLVSKAAIKPRLELDQVLFQP